MIISASRRTDIPAFYSDWFYNRIAEGFALVRNPMNPRQVSRIRLDPESVDCFVFWTKFPGDFIKKLDRLQNYKYYFHFTQTPYGQDVERNVPPGSLVIEVFRKLSDIIGPERIIWRYDPVILNEKAFSIDFHLEKFKVLCDKIGNYTRKCIISFYDHYKFAALNAKQLGLIDISPDTMGTIASGLVNIARDYELAIETCAESTDFTHIGVPHGKCVDDRLISKILGYDIEIKKDKNQREHCGCVKSVDIGAYSTCLHHCLYCYATRNHEAAQKHFQKHDPGSPLLFGELSAEDKVTDRKV